MLGGLVLVGMIAAMAPILALMGGGESAPDDDAEEAPDETGAEEGAGDLLDEPQIDTEPEHQTEARQPADYEYVLGAGNHSIEEFIPGEDTLILTSPTWDFELAETEGPGGGAALAITFGEVTSTVEFPGLGSLPIDDVFIWILEADADPVLVPLSESLAEEDTGDQPLSPTDPDALDDLPTPVDGSRPVSPGDPDAPDTVPHHPSTGTPVAPTDPDAPEP